ncbi:velvet factor-domain-containing protein [Thelonectria olida]|uniref:Velvet factor-domain-containing protein n=1 Tax=Thelonectria olida TaxID=1576542 RepID=A0A9P8W2K7_9HYPO|nr:velvet factor-domain-containing protein [Thelonectria olida]
MFWNNSSSDSMGGPSILPGQGNPTNGNDTLAAEGGSSGGAKWQTGFPKEDRDSNVKLELLQSPKHAKVAVGKEKGRKPIDPPTVLRLVDNRPDDKKTLHPSPFYFVVCDLVTEDEKEVTKDNQSLANALVGTRTSSINHSSESSPWEEAFFVFGDLGVKLEGQFRLRFNLYERDYTAASPSIYHVSQLTSNVFRVYSHREFPGMAESTALTQHLVDIGVKLRRRKDSQAVTTTKRNQKAAEDCRRKQLKRKELAHTSPTERSMSGSSYTLSPATATGARSGPSNSQPLGSRPHSNGHVDFASNPYIGDMSGPSSSPSLPTTSNGYLGFGDASGMGMVPGLSGVGPPQSLPAVSNGFVGFGDTSATTTDYYWDYQGTPYFGATSGATSQALPPASNGHMENGLMDFASGSYTQSPLLTSNSATGSADQSGSFLPSPGASQFLQTDHPSKRRTNWWTQNPNSYGFSET